MKQLFSSVESMQKIIDKFFDSCKPEITKDDKGNYVYNNKTGLPVYNLNPPTLTGLALALGFCSRQSVYDYEKDKKYSYTIKKARLKCENWLEVNLLSGTIPPASGIFALKNYGWRDDIGLTGANGKDLPIKININGVKP